MISIGRMPDSEENFNFPREHCANNKKPKSKRDDFACLQEESERMISIGRMQVYFYLKQHRIYRSSFPETEAHCISGENSAGWSSPEARRAHNPEVTGSNPVPATLSSLPFL